MICEQDLGVKRSVQRAIEDAIFNLSHEVKYKAGSDSLAAFKVRIPDKGKFLEVNLVKNKDNVIQIQHKEILPSEIEQSFVLGKEVNLTCVQNYKKMLRNLPQLPPLQCSFDKDQLWHGNLDEFYSKFFNQPHRSDSCKRFSYVLNPQNQFIGVNKKTPQEQKSIEKEKVKETEPSTNTSSSISKKQPSNQKLKEEETYSYSNSPISFALTSTKEQYKNFRKQYNKKARKQKTMPRERGKSYKHWVEDESTSPSCIPKSFRCNKQIRDIYRLVRQEQFGYPCECVCRPPKGLGDWGKGWGPWEQQRRKNKIEMIVNFCCHGKYCPRLRKNKRTREHMSEQDLVGKIVQFFPDICASPKKDMKLPVPSKVNFFDDITSGSWLVRKVQPNKIQVLDSTTTTTLDKTESFKLKKASCVTKKLKSKNEDDEYEEDDDDDENDDDDEEEDDVEDDDEEEDDDEDEDEDEDYDEEIDDSDDYDSELYSASMVQDNQVKHSLPPLLQTKPKAK